MEFSFAFASRRPWMTGSKSKLTSVVIGNSQIAPNVESNPESEAFFIRIRGPQALGDRFALMSADFKSKTRNFGAVSGAALLRFWTQLTSELPIIYRAAAYLLSSRFIFPAAPAT
jgi:hypothetical protein